MASLDSLRAPCRASLVVSAVLASSTRVAARSPSPTPIPPGGAASSNPVIAAIINIALALLLLSVAVILLTVLIARLGIHFVDENEAGEDESEDSSDTDEPADE